MASPFQILQKSLLDARKDLESTNESIKKLTGFEPKSRTTIPRSNSTSDSRSGPGPERNRHLSNSDHRQERVRPAGNLRAWSGPDPDRKRERERPSEGRSRLGGRLGSSGDNDYSESKRRDSFGARSRLAGRLGPPVDWEERRRDRGRELDSEGEEDGEIVESGSRKPVQSSVVALPAQPRPQADPKEDDKSKKRNQRMFGFLMNTLRKFKDNETTAKGSEKERRRSEIEDKVEKTEELEKEAAYLERKELYDQQKAQRIKISTIAKQMEMVNNFTEWNDHDRKLQGYIETKAKPSIFYLPKDHTPETEELVTKTRQKIEDKINQRLKEIDTFIETANSLKSEAPKSEADSGGEAVGGQGEGEEANNGEMSGPEQ